MIRDQARQARADAVSGVYLDYNGSSPLDPRVAEAMVPVLTKRLGNASSVHRFGRAQAALVDDARSALADFVGGRPSDVVFTSGATEANNLALKGLLESAPPKRTRLLVSAVEHASIKGTAAWIATRALARVETIPVTSGGFVDPETVADMLGDDVLLVSVMAANSETGVLNDVGRIAALASGAGALMHCDATQIVGRLPFDMSGLGVDLVSMSGHKICGPGGVGALVANANARRALSPVSHGGGHERGIRSGSVNVAGVVGLGKAAVLAAADGATDMERIGKLRDVLVAGLRTQVPGIAENGDPSRRLPNTANLRFRGADAEAVLVNMDPVAISTGSACSAGAIEPSPVLSAMGIDRDAAFESLRFSLGRFTTAADIAEAIDRTVSAVEYVRSMNAGAG